MNKLNLYPSDELMAEVASKAKKDGRSLSFVSAELLKRGLKAEKAISVSANSIEQIRKMAIIKEQTYDEIADYLIQYALKEINRQREKAKNRKTKTA